MLGTQRYASPCRLLAPDDIETIYGDPGSYATFNQIIVEKSLSLPQMREESPKASGGVRTQCLYSLDNKAQTSVRVTVMQFISPQAALRSWKRIKRLGTGLESKQLEQEGRPELQWLIDLAKENEANMRWRPGEGSRPEHPLRRRPHRVHRRTPQPGDHRRPRGLRGPGVRGQGDQGHAQHDPRGLQPDLRQRRQRRARPVTRAVVLGAAERLAAVPRRLQGLRRRDHGDDHRPSQHPGRGRLDPPRPEPPVDPQHHSPARRPCTTSAAGWPGSGPAP